MARRSVPNINIILCKRSLFQNETAFHTHNENCSKSLNEDDLFRFEIVRTVEYLTLKTFCGVLLVGISKCCFSHLYIASQIS